MPYLPTLSLPLCLLSAQSRLHQLVGRRPRTQLGDGRAHALVGIGRLEAKGHQGGQGIGGRRRRGRGDRREGRGGGRPCHDAGGHLEAHPGQEGQERWIWLRLKLIADAGLVGLPNAGKSTFLATVTAAKPKIADYPFTTLHPGLGVVRIDGREFVLADIPGLIEGAHEGHGLGDRFLGHVERCRVLLHLIDATSEHAGKAYKIVRDELDAYGHGLEDKIEIVALSKIDAVTPEQLKEQKARLKRAAKKEPLLISAASNQGITETLRALALSYFDPFIDTTGCIKAYGAVDLRVLDPYPWRLSAGNVWKVSDLLYEIPHRPIRSSAARVDRLRAKYFRFRREHPGQKPDYYDQRDWQ